YQSTRPAQAVQNTLLPPVTTGLDTGRVCPGKSEVILVAYRKFDRISPLAARKYRDRYGSTAMALTDTGQHHSDGNGTYLLVTPARKYWRLCYRHLGKRKTPDRGRRDPRQARQEKNQDEIFAATQTFELTARRTMEKTAANRAETTRHKVTGWLENDAFPYIGKSPRVDVQTARLPGVRAAHGGARRCAAWLRQGCHDSPRLSRDGEHNARPA
ncbi:MAG: integrase, partial [Massilia sp.]|nr:integrase [Massilia sp.]